MMERKLAYKTEKDSGLQGTKQAWSISRHCPSSDGHEPPVI